jgi:hypothetical protein
MYFVVGISLAVSRVNTPCVLACKLSRHHGLFLAAVVHTYYHHLYFIIVHRLHLCHGFGSC